MLIEEVEEYLPRFEITIDGSTTEYEGYAAYCKINDIESFSVSNNEDLLGNDLWAESLAQYDFVINYRKDQTSEFTINGTALEVNSQGQVDRVYQDLNGITNITQIDEKQIVGRISGNFLKDNGEVIEYSVEFASLVIPGVTPILCQ